MTKDIYIKDLKINSFRGLSNVDLKHCCDVNLVLGDNNAGKTSLLEAIYMLKNNDLYNFVNVAKCRQESKTLSISSIRFFYPLDTREISVFAHTSETTISFSSSFTTNQITFDKNVYFDNDVNSSPNVVDSIIKSIIDSTNHDGKHIGQIVGEIKYNEDTTNYALIDLDFYGKISKTNKDENRIIYVSPSNHYNLSTLNVSLILKNKNYHNILVELLKLFDSSVEDIIILEQEGVFGSSEIAIRRHGIDEAEPISLFGDGMKKVIVLATYLVQASGGILLIDEIETSLHYSLYSDVFSFLLLAAKKFKVQLFIATHNIEAIDSILNVDLERLENTCLITLRNNKGQLSYRCLNGKDAKSYRENISMEVR